MRQAVTPWEETLGRVNAQLRKLAQKSQEQRGALSLTQAGQLSTTGEAGGLSVDDESSS